MSDNPTPTDDFISDTPAPSTPKKSNTALPWIILGCVGCGSFGVIILGILAAIAIPAFLNQTDKANQAVAKTSIGAMMREQQAHHLEKAKFATSVEDLGLGLPLDTAQYSYKMVPGDNATSVFIYATPKEEIAGFVGAVFAVGNDPATAITYTGLCQNDAVGSVSEEPPTLDVSLTEPTVVCPPGSSLVE